MIYKISIWFLLPMCILALFLSLAGVHQIEFGDSYYSFLRSVNSAYSSWRLEIPDIPKIEKINTGNYDKSGLILAVLIKIANFFVGVVNALIVILNLFINVINVVVQLIQFFLTAIYQCKDFIHRVTT